MKKFYSFVKPMDKWKSPINVSLTGASGNVAYAMHYRICSGEIFGFD